MTMDRTAPYGTIVDYPNPNATVWTNAFHQGFQDRIDADPALQSYTPTWACVSGTNPVVGNGTITGNYTRKGRIVTLRILVTMGSTTTYGTGTWSFTLPVTPAGSLANGCALGSALCGDASAGNYGAMVLWTPDATHLYLAVQAGNFAITTPPGGIALAVDATHPFTWASTDVLWLMTQYYSS
jgi:hypothetical protein